MALGAELTRSGAVASFELLPGLLAETEGTANGAREHVLVQRRAAARLGLDAVLVVRSLGELDTGLNPLALLDLTIVGAWLAPGHEARSSALLEAGVFDVHNEYLYAAAEGESAASATRPGMYHEPREVARKARLAALEELAGDLAGELARATNGTHE